MSYGLINLFKCKIGGRLFPSNLFKSADCPSKQHDCYILGSGRSLLDLTQEETAHINRSPFVLAFNKYIIFHDKVGIVPTHYLLADHGEKAIKMFRETMKICEKNQFNDIQFIFSNLLIDRVKKNPELKKLFTRTIRKRSFLIERNNWLEGGRWAQTLKEPIYHYRGSLSGAINITSLANPGQTIKLLGVDLNNYEYFFQEEIENDKEKWGIFLKRLTPESSQHATITTFNGSEGIQKVFPFIIQNVQDNKGDLVCCNVDSYLVTQKILSYSPVISS